MSSIFNASYSDSIKRLDATAQSRDLGKDLARTNTAEKTSGGEKFSEVLSSINSQKAGDPSARGSLGYQPLEQRKDASAIIQNEARGALSNLSFNESQNLAQGAQSINAPMQGGLEAYRLSKTELSLENKTDASLEVARLSPDIKNVLNTQPVPQQGKVPAAPKLLSALSSEKTGVIDAPKPILPAPPKVKSIASNEKLLEDLISDAGRHHGIDPNLSVAVARAESSLRPNAVSSDGHHSKGIFQLLDHTGKSMMEKLDVEGSYKPFDPKLNAHLGVGYLRRLHNLFSKESNLGFNIKTFPVKSAEDLEKVSVAAFNAGEGRVARAQKKALAAGKDPGSYDAIEPYLPASTRSYVERVGNLKSVAETRDEETSLA
jgi:soluble lytic murein transglycosylase-like protein